MKSIKEIKDIRKELILKLRKQISRGALSKCITLCSDLDSSFRGGILDSRNNTFNWEFEAYRHFSSDLYSDLEFVGERIQFQYGVLLFRNRFKPSIEIRIHHHYGLFHLEMKDGKEGIAYTNGTACSVLDRLISEKLLIMATNDISINRAKELGIIR
jgi:hypothetical protein